MATVSTTRRSDRRGPGWVSVQSVGEEAEHCPWPEKQGSHSSFIPPLILVLHFICFHSLRSPSYFQWSTWGQRDVRAACGCTRTPAHTGTRKDTPGHKSASWKETSSSKGPRRTVTQEGPVPIVAPRGPLTSFSPLTPPQDRLLRCNPTRWFLCPRYLWPPLCPALSVFVFFLSFIFSFYGFVCLFLSARGRSSLGSFSRQLCCWAQHKFGTMTDKCFVGSGGPQWMCLH